MGRKKTAKKSPPLRRIDTKPATDAGLGQGGGASGPATGHPPGQRAELATLLSAIMELDASERYRPAYLAKGQEWKVIYQVRHPDTGLWHRRKEKLNHIRDRKERRRYGEQRVRELNRRLSLGWSPFTHADPSASVVPLADALAAFLAAKEREGLRKDSLRSYHSNMGIFLRWLQERGLDQQVPAAFTPGLAAAFMHTSYVERELAPKTFNNYHTYMVTVWNWLKDARYIRENPFLEVKKKKVDPEGPNGRRPPTAEERARIRTYLQEHDPRFLTFALLCFHCAIRPKEAFLLKPEHFHLKEQYILIPGRIAKNKRTQGVAVPNVLLPHLVGLGLDRQRPQDYVFSTGFRPGSQLKDSRHSGRHWRTMADAIGLAREVTFYQLKHAGGEQLSRDGLGEVDLMNHFRHRDLKETSIYTRRAYQGGVRTVLDRASEF